MKSMPQEEWLPYAPDNPGRVRVNHTSSGCSGGRSSMVVRRYEDGGVSAYCYRCGGKGSYSPKFRRTKRAVAKSATHKVVKRGFHIPKDATPDITQWPRDLRVWVLSSLTEDEARVWGFVYSPSLDQLIMPLDKENFICRLSNYREYKYISYINNIEYILYNNKESDKIVLVEDYLSYIKLSRYYSVCCLLGTTLTDKALLAITKEHNNFVVFLDNDNALVKRKQTAIRNRLKLFGSVKVVKHTRDPKHCTYEELQEII